MQKDHEILQRVKKYFKIYELVGLNTYSIYGESAWKFLDIRLLEALFVLRYHLGKPIKINDWFWGGQFEQRGLRTNLQTIFSLKFHSKQLYLSGHVLGKAIDFDVKDMSADEVREWIVENQDLFPFQLRLEHINKATGRSINWVHLDVIQDFDRPKVYLFDV